MEPRVPTTLPVSGTRWPDNDAQKTCPASDRAEFGALVPPGRYPGSGKGRVRGALPARIDGVAGAVWARGGLVRAAFVFAIERRQITGIDISMDPARLAGLDVKIA